MRRAGLLARVPGGRICRAAILNAQRLEVLREGTQGRVFRRFTTTASFPGGAQFESTKTVPEDGQTPVVPAADMKVGVWLVGVAGMVFAMVSVGGITRLTESGLSIVDWRPITGTIPPLTEADWEAEFAKYRTSPEFVQNSTMTLADFKTIFFWEWAHRVMGRVIGLVYLGPLAYFAARGVLPAYRGLRGRLALFGFLGGAQGALGWFMVKSGLEHERFKDGKKASVSPYRLAAHLGMAFTLYIGLLDTALRLRTGTFGAAAAVGARGLVLPVRAAGFWIFLTAMTGAAVAGLDAGWIYCEFPYMGNGLVPPNEELFLEGIHPVRNLYENAVAAQFTHRCMAMGSIAAVGGLTLAARGCTLSAPMVTALRAVQGLTFWQASLGVVALVNATPIPLAVLHQASSLALLTSFTVLHQRLSLNSA